MSTSAVKKQADRSIKGVGVPDLHLNMIKKFLIPVPNLKIQDDFVKKTENLHQLKSSLKSNVKIPDSLTTKLVKSRLELSQLVPTAELKNNLLREKGT